MKNKIKVSKKINCSTCQCLLTRTKSIEVDALNIEEAKKEANVKILEWSETLKDQDCKICKSIKSDLVKAGRL